MLLLRLSRLSFWLAAAVAALALLAPAGHETLLTAVAGGASLLALGLWRSALHREQRLPVALLMPATPPVLTEAALREAASQLVRGAREAASFEAALHAVARVLRSELGARAVAVHQVHGVDATHARLSDLIESQPGFRTVERRLRLDGAPLARALRERREAGAPPGPVALPVLADGRVVAAIELAGLALPIEPQALAGLLELARSTLSQKASAAGVPAAVRPSTATPTRCAALRHANVLVIEDNVVQPEVSARVLRRLGCRVTAACRMQDGLKALRETQFDLVLIDLQISGADAAEGLRQLRGAHGAGGGRASATGAPVIALSAAGLPNDGERVRQLGFDDHLFKPFRRGQMLAMLSKHLRPPAPTGASGAPASGHGGAAEPPADEGSLDAAALGRLIELDPNGQNRLLERVLQAFQTSAARLRPQLDAARSGNDRAAIRLVAHTLKSSSASIGAIRLSQLCAQVETAIRLETEDDLGPQLDALNAALDGALQAIAALLKERE